MIFRLLRGNLPTSLDKTCVAVQLPIDDANPNKRAVEKFLTDYFHSNKIRIYWGTAHQFAKELWERWRMLDVEQAS